jgi:hypothetical protein
MITYTVTLSSAEDDALSYVAHSQQEWIDNAIHERARLAIDEIAQITIVKCLELNIQIPGSKDEMVALGFEMGWVSASSQRSQETQNII